MFIISDLLSFVASNESILRIIKCTISVLFFQTDSIDSSTTSSSDTGESNSHKIRHRMRPRPHFKAGAGGQQRSSGRKLSTPGGSATTNYSMTCLERLIRTHPIWFLPKLNRDEASEFLTGKGSGVRIADRYHIIWKFWSRATTLLAVLRRFYF